MIHPQNVFAAFLARWILGLLFLMAGWWKVFELGPDNHAQTYFIDSFAETWIPQWWLWPLGVAIPWIELAAGVMLILGLGIRPVLYVLGLLLLVTTYGHALLQPLFDIDGHTFTRLALIVFLLVHGWDGDPTAAESWLKKKAGSQAR